MTNKIRVLLADDSDVARGLLRSYLEEEKDFEVVGEADNGETAVTLAASLRPDLITMDLEMPRLGGLQAIEEIMSRSATPILVVSSVADARNAYSAVTLGAVDVVRKPGLDAEERQDFVNKARLVAGVRVITHVRRQRWFSREDLPTPAKVNAIAQPDPDRRAAVERVVVIACSTGGPQALARILSMLPAGFPAPILIAQHISVGFSAGMAEWLASLCTLPVRLGEDGQILQAGVVTFAPSEYHMAINASHQVVLQERQEKDLYRPCCDVLLRSAAKVYRKNCIGVILTGMGQDGREGMRAIHEAGGQTIAQDEASSVIFGMNALAIAAGVVDQVVPLDEIASAIVHATGMQG